MPYFLIRCNDDGETSVRQVDPNKLAREIVEGEHEVRSFCAKLPEGYTDMWGPERMVLIKGEIIRPEVVEVVERVTIP